jgi:hypothetical protein
MTVAKASAEGLNSGRNQTADYADNTDLSRTLSDFIRAIREIRGFKQNRIAPWSR